MQLKNDMLELADSEIIGIIENPKNAGADYKRKADNELASRNIAFEKIKELAVTITEKIAYERIVEAARIHSNKIIQHTSHFLSKAEVRQIYINQLEKYEKDTSVFIMPFFI